MEEVIFKLMLITALFASTTGFFMIKLHYAKTGLMILFIGFAMAALALGLDTRLMISSLILLVIIYYPILKAVHTPQKYQSNHNNISTTH